MCVYLQCLRILQKAISYTPPPNMGAANLGPLQGQPMLLRPEPSL